MNRMTRNVLVHFTRSEVKGRNVLFLLLLLLTTILLNGLVTPPLLFAAPGDITTIAGGGVGDTGFATSASLYLPRGIHVTASGVIYVADTLNHRVRKIDANGIITTVAGNGRPGYSGDGGLATSASLKYPMGVTVDKVGNIIIADAHNHRVRKVNASGVISTIVGGGTENAGNYCSLPASEIANISPRNIFLDSSDRVHITDGQLWRLEADGMLINLSDPTCGNGSLEPGFSSGFFDTSGAFIYASGNNIFRTMDMQSSTLLGPFADVSSGDYITLSGDAFGNIYVAFTQANSVYKLDSTGVSTIFAGTGVAGYSGDGESATSANLSNPADVFSDAAGNVYITDRFNHCIRKVDLNGTIVTVAGTGEFGYAGDGLTATSARLSIPRGVFADSAGNVYVADTYNHRVRKIDTAGIMTTIAGNGAADFSGDNGPASAASLYYPSGIYVHTDGTIFIADSFNDRIRKVDPTGTITTIAGTEDTGYDGDGGPATLAVLKYPTGVLVDGSGNVFIADSGNNAIRKIDPSGIISTYANIMNPHSIAFDSSGVLYVATNYDGINRVYPGGTVDLIPSCSDAVGVSVDSAGTVYMACQSGHTIEAATPGMKPGRVAGTWDAGFSGDSGQASAAMLASPNSVFVAASGALYIADSENNRVRKVEPGFEIVPIPPLVTIISPAAGLVTKSKTPLLSYTVSEGAVVVKIDGAVVSKVSGQYLDPLAEGQHTVRVEATDENGTGFAEVSFTIDTVAPIISIVSPQGVLSNNNPLLIYSVNEAVAYSYVKLDGIQKWMFSGDSLGTLSDGQHSVEVVAQDYAWNTGTAVVNFTIDTMPPRVTITSPQAGMTNSNTPLLSYTASNGSVVVKVDGIAVSKVSGQYLDPLADGQHTIRVEATDEKGTGYAQRAFTVDSAAPAPIPDLMEDFETGDLGKLPWTTSGNGLWTVKSAVKHGGIFAAEAPQSIGNSQSATLEVRRTTVSDSISFWYSVSSEANYDFLRFYVDGIQKGQWSGTVPWTQTSYPISAGTHTFKWVYSKDGLGSTGADTAWLDDIVFPMPAYPTVTITSPAAGTTNNSTPLLAYTSSGGTIVVKIDNVAVSKVSGNTLDPLADGNHTVRVEATNENGTGFSERTFTLDTLLPAVGIDPVTTPTKTANQTIVGTRESNATVSVEVNTTATVGVVSYPSTTTWSCDISGMAQGNNSITVTATDAAANSATAGTSIFVDTVAPSVIITLPVSGLTNNKTPALNYTVSDGAVVVKIDGVVALKVSGDTLDTLVDGSHAVRVEATDPVGNTGFAEVSFTIDTIAPTVVISSPVMGITKNKTPLLTYTVSDGAVVVKVDGVIVPKVSGNTLDALADGTHTVQVESTDAAGNTWSAQVSFTIDTVPPTTTINAVTSPTNVGSQTISGTRESDAAITVSVNTPASVGSVAYPTATAWSCAITGLMAGGNTITVTSTDTAGNSTNAGADITLDISAPIVTITSPAIGTTNNKTPVLTYNASDGTVVVKVDGTIVNKVSGNNLDSLADGLHTVQVEATDAAGNSGFVSITFTIDTVAPTLTMNSVSSPTRNKTQTVSGTREGGSTVTVNANTSATIGSVSYLSSTTWSCTVSNMVTGVNTITATAKDAANNTASASRSITVK